MDRPTSSPGAGHDGAVVRFGRTESYRIASRLVPDLRRAFVVAIVALGAVAASVATLYAVHQWNARWVAHSRTVARVARDLRVATVAWQRASRASAGSSAPRIDPSADSARRYTRALADTLARLTADNPAQHRGAEQIRAAVERWESAATAVQPRRGAGAIAADVGAASAGRVTGIERAETAFLQAEDRLYGQRLRRERVWQVATLVTVLAELTALTLVLLRFRRQLVAEAVREVDQQAQLEEQAIELEAQASELEEANEDLSRAVAEASLARGVTESIVREQQALIRALPDTVLVFDRSGRMLKVESTARPLLSRPPETMLGRSLHELLPVDTADRCLAAIHEALGEQHLVEVEYDVRHADRVVSWAATASPMGRGIVVWVARDITERRAHELQQRQRHKLEAIGQLAGGVAHDFNNMLTAIRAYAQLALGEVDAAGSVADDLREIDSAATRAAALTRQLLAFSRNQALQPRPVMLADVVAGVERMLQRLLLSDVRLRVERGADEGPVSVDPGQIEQVVMNLAVNARDAMPEGGELLIATGTTILDEPHRRDAFEIPPGDYATLTVADEGTGMTPETLGRIFEPFFTTKAVGRGTGLGLATVYGIVQQSGGHLAVETAVGKGTRFTLYFPHIATEMPEQAPTLVGMFPPAGALPPRRARRILLVDDEASIRTGLARGLRSAGHDVVTAPNGEVALEFVAATQLPFDLVITDLIMPVVGGRALGERLAQRAPGLPVLYMSGHSDVVGRERLLASGAVLLEKPFGPARLVDEVERFFAQRDRPARASAS